MRDYVKCIRLILIPHFYIVNQIMVADIKVRSSSMFHYNNLFNVDNSNYLFKVNQKKVYKKCIKLGHNKNKINIKVIYSKKFFRN